MFSLVISYFMDPDLLFPYVRGGKVNGIAKYFGPNGGRIAVSLFLYSILNNLNFFDFP
jgi:hypothetical protein